LENNGFISVCLNSFKNLHGIFRKQWQHLKKNGAKQNYVPGPRTHGNMGRSNRRTTSNIVQATPSLIEFLQDVSDSYGEPYATRFVREITGTTLRESEVDAVEMPSNFTKRKLYRDYCFAQGHLAKADAKGSYGAIRNFDERPVDDLLWLEGSVPLPICAWQGFLTVWKKNFPNLTIRNPCEDTCGECTKIKNRMHLLDRIEQRRAVAAQVDNNNEDEDDSVSIENGNSDNDNESYSGPLLEEYELFNQQEFPAEAIILHASLHLERAKRQREYASNRIVKSKESANYEWEERR